MMNNLSISRRDFFGLLGAGATAASLPRVLSAAQPPTKVKAKPILGSWISVFWSDRRHHYWNEPCAKFTAEQWECSVKEVADLGMQYLVLLATVNGDQACYNSRYCPKTKLIACDDPIEALLSAADRFGVRFFISTGCRGGWLDYNQMSDPKLAKLRFEVMAEVAEKYGRHKSFFGWYLPDEVGLDPYFTDVFIKYVADNNREGKRLLPGSKTLIAPYGTKNIVADAKFCKQLERLDADIIAYQDEVGCLRATTATSAAVFEKLRHAHDKAPQRTLWADVEVFDWEGPPNQPTTPLIPAPFERVKRQLDAVSPFVDLITIYQYQGLMSQPGSKAATGHRDATTLYRDYVRWLKAEYPEMVKGA